MATKIVSGQTPRGATKWAYYNQDHITLVVEVDTSAAKFSSTPVYIASLGGDSGHWEASGAASSYTPTSSKFNVYISFVDHRRIEIEAIKKLNWYINWIGMEG